MKRLTRSVSDGGQAFGIPNRNWCGLGLVIGAAMGIPLALYVRSSMDVRASSSSPASIRPVQKMTAIDSQVQRARLPAGY